MPTIRSAKKRMRQDIKRKHRNLTHKKRLKSQVKKLRKAIAAGDQGAATRLLSPTISVIDKSVKHGILHKNAAARRKSRLMSAVSSISPSTEGK